MNAKKKQFYLFNYGKMYLEVENGKKLNIKVLQF